MHLNIEDLCVFFNNKDTKSQLTIMVINHPRSNKIIVQEYQTILDSFLHQLKNLERSEATIFFHLALYFY